MSRVRTILARMPDADGTLRCLADVIRVPSTCRRRKCREQGCCQGGQASDPKVGTTYGSDASS